ncbi:hypothetical protein [Streptomyces sp. NPDC002640]
MKSEMTAHASTAMTGGDGLPFSGLRHEVRHAPPTGATQGSVSACSDVWAIILKILTDPC